MCDAVFVWHTGAVQRRDCVGVEETRHGGELCPSIMKAGRWCESADAQEVMKPKPPERRPIACSGDSCVAAVFREPLLQLTA